VGEYLPEHYTERLAEIMRIHQNPAPVTRREMAAKFADNPGHAR
jgi:hypothetical protein